MSEMIAYCGLNCEDCRAFKATQAHDLEWKKKIAKDWSEETKIHLTPEDVDCGGCKSKKLSGWCLRVCKIRPCAAERKVETCAHCSDYQCQKLIEFLPNEPKAMRNLQEMRKTVQI